MGGVALNGKRVSLADGKDVAALALQALDGCFTKALVCGSIRRERPEVGDVDIVVIGNDKLDACLTELCGLQKNGKPKRKYLLHGVQIDFYPATEEDFGAQCLMWTGSKEFNIRCRKAAQDKGILLNQYGAWRDDVRLAGATEESVLKAIGLDYLDPKARS